MKYLREVFIFMHTWQKQLILPLQWQKNLILYYYIGPKMVNVKHFYE